MVLSVNNHTATTFYSSVVEINVYGRFVMFCFASYFELHLNYDTHQRLHWKLYEKHNEFIFWIVNCCFLCRNKPASLILQRIVWLFHSWYPMVERVPTVELFSEKQTPYKLLTRIYWKSRFLRYENVSYPPTQYCWLVWCVIYPKLFLIFFDVS